jgi:thiol-disulfide isomerase/thioredoxin
VIKRSTLIWLLFLCSLAANAGVITTIRGTIEGANGYQIRLLTWADQVTLIEKKLASATIDAQGRFNLIADIQTTTYAFFAIGNVQGDIILEPGQAYEIAFDPYLSLDELETRNLILQREKLGFRILNEPTGGLNGVVQEASRMYNQFLANHYMDLYMKRYTVVDAFVDTFFLRFGGYTNPWIRQMVDYRIASLKLSGYKVSIEQAHDLWLNGVDFDYDHPDFMDFFNQLFSNYLTTRLKHYSYQDLKDLINNNKGYFALSEMVGRDTVLRNEVLREMVIIKGLGEILNHKDFEGSMVLNLLQQINATSKFREHRLIASNLIYLYTRFNKGAMASDFSLPDQAGLFHQLPLKQGKYLYLVFYMSNCIPCLSELQMLQSIYPLLKKELEVVAIGLDPDQEKFWRVTARQAYPWPVLHFNNDYELTDRYNIRNYPVFILIAPDGSFESYSVRQPSAQFKPWFEEVVLKQK